VGVDQNGHFSVEIPPGKYRVVARSWDPSGAVAVSDPQAVTLSEHGHTTIELAIAAKSEQN
jgi:hypothetical protein